MPSNPSAVSCAKRLLWRPPIIRALAIAIPVIMEIGIVKKRADVAADLSAGLIDT